MEHSLVVLAAGIGSRYGGLKQLDAFGPCGETIIDYSLYDAHLAGFNHIVFVIRKDTEADFHAAFGAKLQDHFRISYAHQELDALPAGCAMPVDRVKPWGTGHALLVTEPYLDGPFAVINADDFYGAGTYRVLAEYLQAMPDSDLPEYAMVGFILRMTLSPFGTVSRGICQCDCKNYLFDIEELTRIEVVDDKIINTAPDGSIRELSGYEPVSMNTWALSPSFFPYLHKRFGLFFEQHGQEPGSECFLPSVINDLIREGDVRLQVLPGTDTWFGVTYQEDRDRVEEEIQLLIQRGDYPEKLWA
ncbi:MAG: nucleotidyltransferase [Spartobacteria bacterium]|nr:nucleotidyltransferase [Spartobacteria bacterium]